VFSNFSKFSKFNNISNLWKSGARIGCVYGFHLISRKGAKAQQRTQRRKGFLIVDREEVVVVEAERYGISTTATSSTTSTTPTTDGIGAFCIGFIYGFFSLKVSESGQDFL
jgi:hypothetical protein